MISDPALAALRNGAALVHLLPQARLRLRSVTGPLLDVARPPWTEEGTPLVSPDAFRDAVAAEHAQRRLGDVRRLLHLPAAVELAVDLGLPRNDRVLPGGIVRAMLGGVWVHLLAVASDLDVCLNALGSGLHGLSCHHDQAVGVTVLHSQSPLGDSARADDARDRVEEAAARCTVAALEVFLRDATSAGLHATSGAMGRRGSEGPRSTSGEADPRPMPPTSR